MAERRAQLTFFIGLNGTGKSTAQKQFLGSNERNLIWPASIYDKAWSAYPKIKPQKMIIDHPKSIPGQDRKVAVYRIKDINKFKGTRVVDTSDINDGELVIECFKSTLNEKTGFRKGGLFIDDYKNLIKSHGILPYEVRKLMSNMRHIEVDVFMATHGMREVNFQFYQHNPVFYIFRSDSPPGEKVKKQYARYDELMEVYERVMQKSETNIHYCERFPK